MGFSFSSGKRQLEKEGIFIGGWGVKNILWPRKVNGKHGE